MAVSSVKPWKLTEEETFSSFTSWQQNMLYCLNQEKNNTRFLLASSPDAAWKKDTPTQSNRGFTNDADENGIKKEEKALNLRIMLGYLSQYVPHYLSTDIVTNSTSINSVWAMIRSYYGFQQSEVNFMKYATITWAGKEAERPERLYRRIVAHIQDNLLTAGSRIKHNDATLTVDEVMVPSLERMAVLKWLELLHPKLPALVARTFARDLQTRSLKDIQPQICDALDGFFEEIERDEVQASRVYSQPRHYSQDARSPYQNPRATTSRRQHQSRPPTPSHRPFPPRRHNRSPVSRPPIVKQCRVCRLEGRPFHNHNIATCVYVSDTERGHIHSVRVEDDDHDDDMDPTFDTTNDVEEESHE